MIDREEAQQQDIATVAGNSQQTANKQALLEKLKNLLPNLINSDGKLDIKSLRCF